MQLPLFQGVTRERISQAAGLAKFHFLKYPEGEKIISAGEACTHIKFVISGTVRVKSTNRYSMLSVEQDLKAPDVIAPEFLFGMATDYVSDVKAVDSVGILQISKSDFLTILHSDEVFMLNYLNVLSMASQTSVGGMLSGAGGTIRSRIAYWICVLTQPGAENISLNCRQRDLYTFFGVQRSIFVAALDEMVEQGLITYDAMHIRPTSRKAMLDLLR